jgi:hypothetical protein
MAAQARRCIIAATNPVTGADVANKQAINQGSEIDFELFEEYAASLEETIALIERNVRQLGEHPDDLSPVAVLFRTFHNLKGDAALCRFDFGLQTAHLIESLLMRLREGKLRYSALLGEALLLALDRLELSVEAILSAKPADPLRQSLLLENLAVLAETTPAKLDQAAADMIERVSGFRPASALPATTQALGTGIGIGASSDMVFFRSLALQLEQRSPLFEGRTARLLQLALAMNEIGGKKVDPIQLEAAIYLHDIGMMLLPEPIWLKPGKLDAREWAQMRQHPGFGAGLLSRMTGWDQAAEIIAQHHEMPDGKGYPLGIRAAAITPGAKIMAIADAFEAVMLKHRHRGQNLSVLRAAAEINACESQFAQEWIGPFNKAVKKMQ